MPTSLIAFTVSLIASLSLTVPVRQLAVRVGMVDHPGPRKVHLTPIPLLGGLAMYCGVVLGILVSMDGQAGAQIVGLLAGATVVATVGVMDDSGVLHHRIILFVAMPDAAFVQLLSAIHPRVVSSPG